MARPPIEPPKPLPKKVKRNGLDKVQPIRYPPVYYGRPRTWNDNEIQAFETRIDEYFQKCAVDNAPATVPGLACYLGMVSRQQLWEYGFRPAFTHAVKRAMLAIEAQRVGALASGVGNPAGGIFDLKNNAGYVDRSEVRTGEVTDHESDLDALLQDGRGKAEPEFDPLTDEPAPAGKPLH